MNHRSPTPPSPGLTPSRRPRCRPAVLRGVGSFRLPLGLAVLLLAGCGTDAPILPAAGGPAAAISTTSDAVASTPSPSALARIMDDLRAETARFHDIEEAVEAGYTFDVGCVDERAVEGVGAEEARGMGRHLVDLSREFDGGQVDLRKPEIVLYARNEGSGELRLAALDYVVHAIDVPAPEDGGEPPVMPRLGLPFEWSPAHDVWMFHIWLWWPNPDGVFADWNPTVPLCDCPVSPETGRCIPE